MNNIIVKEVGIGEVGVFYDVFCRVIKEEFPEYSDRIVGHLLSKSFTLERFQREIESLSVVAFLAYLGDQVVGFAYGRKADVGVSYLSWLGVVGEHQKKGIGKALVGAWEEKAKKDGVHVIHLNTYDRDLEFYKKLGYTVIGLDKKSWFGIDNHILRKYIQEPDLERMLQ